MSGGLRTTGPEDEYARFAALYDLMFNPVLDRLRRVVLDVLRRSGARSVLDVCCGTGRQAVFLRGAGLAVHGVDLSSAMLRAARRKCPPGVGLALADARALPFPGHAFDCAVAGLALHEMDPEEREAALDELVRVARSVLVVDYLAPEGVRRRMGAVLCRLPERAAGSRHWGNYRRFMASGALQGLLARRGLRVLDLRSLYLGSVGVALAR